jgi:pantetheine-phosphate adenylyltransferase
MIEECTSDLDNVFAYSNPNNLVVNFADSKDAVAIIRGLRHVSDFELEFQMANVNHGINPEISTILMVSNERFLHLNSSIIRELAEYKTDLSKFVPKSVEDRLIEKFKGK